MNEPGIKNVFLGSMTDFFGDFINADWIFKTLEVVKKTPQWNYLILTKNPLRIHEFTPLPRNVWIGTTVDTQARVEAAEEAFSYLNGGSAAVTFLSCEPLRDKLEFTDMSMFDWVIIGGQSRSSGASAAQPQWEWVEELLIQARASGCKVYFKPNLTIRPREYPERSVKCL
jgi:protein gp37